MRREEEPDMDEKQQTDASAVADAVLGQDDTPYHPPVEPASEPVETSLIKEGEAVAESPE
jgi:hypothetical protein